MDLAPLPARPSPCTCPDRGPGAARNRGEESRMRTPAILVVPVVLFGLGIGLAAATSAPESSTWLLVWLNMVIVLLPFVVAAFRKRFDPFEPIYLFSVCILLIFVMRPIWDLLAPSGVPILDLGRRKIDV